MPAYYPCLEMLLFYLVFSRRDINHIETPIEDFLDINSRLLYNFILGKVITNTDYLSVKKIIWKGDRCQCLRMV